MAKLKHSLSFLGFLLCVAGFSKSATGQPKVDQSTQWKASIERPTSGWDYDGKEILGHIGYDICLWDAESGKLLHRMKGHKERIHAAQFSPDGHHALTSSWMPAGPMQPNLKSKDTRTILWNLETGRERDSFPGQVAGEFNPDGTRIITFNARPDKLKMTYEFTNPETGKVKPYTSVESVTRYDNATVWETFTARQLVKAKLDEYAAPDDDTLHFSRDGRRFVHLHNGRFVAYNSSGGVVFNTSDGREIGRIERNDVKFGSGHRYTSKGSLATFEPTQARLIDFESGRVVQTMAHDLRRSWGTLWTHDGSKFAALPRAGGNIMIGNLKSGKMITGAKTHQSVGRAVVSPDNSRLAITWSPANDTEPSLTIYDMETGQEMGRSEVPDFMSMIGFSPDSKTLLIGGAEFMIYNAENGQKIRSLKLIDDAHVDRWTQ